MPRFRKWKNRISVYDVAYEQHRSLSVDVDKIRHAVLDEWVESYAEALAFREYKKTAYDIEWSCLSCKAPVEINVHGLVHYNKRLNKKQFYCSNCMPKTLTKALNTDPILLRYVNSFYGKLKNIVKINSHLEDYL